MSTTLPFTWRHLNNKCRFSKRCSNTLSRRALGFNHVITWFDGHNDWPITYDFQGSNFSLNYCVASLMSPKQLPRTKIKRFWNANTHDPQSWWKPLLRPCVTNEIGGQLCDAFVYTYCIDIEPSNLDMIIAKKLWYHHPSHFVLNGKFFHGKIIQGHL